MEETMEVVKKSSPFAKHKKLITAVIAIICAAVIAVTGTLVLGESKEEQVLTALDNFAAAFNSGDTEKMYETLDSKSRNAVKSSSKIGSGLSGVDIQSWMSLLLSLSGMNSSEPVLKIEVHSIEFESGKKVTLNSTMITTVPSIFGNQTEKTKVPINMVKEKGEWRVCLY